MCEYMRAFPEGFPYTGEVVKLVSRGRIGHVHFGVYGDSLIPDVRSLIDSADIV